MKRKSHNKRDLTGQVFGVVTVVREVSPKLFPSGCEKARVLAECECGTMFVVLSSSLTTGNTKSCGCKAKRLLSERSKTHGLTGTRVYRIWQGMLNRCRNENIVGHHNWGGRGITVCEEWKEFESFLADMGHPPVGFSIERINNDGNYEPGNCKWATRTEQSRNRRTNRIITFNGESLCLKAWADRLKMDQASLSERLSKWPIHAALTKPKEHRHVK
jgi:hypothetical protein